MNNVERRLVFVETQVNTVNKTRLATEEEINEARWSRLRRLGKKVKLSADWSTEFWSFADWLDVVNCIVYDFYIRQCCALGLLCYPYAVPV